MSEGVHQGECKRAWGWGRSGGEAMTGSIEARPLISARSAPGPGTGPLGDAGFLSRTCGAGIRIRLRAGLSGR